jgi:hypothetical protein
MDRDEILKVIKLAQKEFAPKKGLPPRGSRIVEAFTRGKGKPSKWHTARGIQMVREVQAGMRASGLSENEIIRQLLIGGWRERFPKDTRANIRRGYLQAKRWLAEQTDNGRKS